LFKTSGGKYISPATSTAITRLTLFNTCDGCGEMYFPQMFEQLLLAIGDAQKTVFINGANVTGFEPSSSVNTARVLQAYCNNQASIGSTRFDFAIDRNADLNVRYRFPTVPIRLSSILPAVITGEVSVRP